MTEPSSSRASGEARGIQKSHLLAALLGFIVFFVASAAIVASRVPEVDQPIRFNHRIHTVENEMACTECHGYYEKEAFSGLPDRDTCAFCHEEAQGESAQEAALVELLSSGASLEWMPLFRQPAHVFYSHRRHVVAAGLECEACHGEIGQSESPPRRVGRLEMSDCIDCHERENASGGCTTCHR
ncbi:MAG TPA: cytochrome c3 family protein [Vicinamibacteria bacterium]|nr:cytochrome c3 family protein [Vicinamibacteria bacterium]